MSCEWCPFVGCYHCRHQWLCQVCGKRSGAGEVLCEACGQPPNYKDVS